jgi:hypothetical protein
VGGGQGVAHGVGQLVAAVVAQGGAQADQGLHDRGERLAGVAEPGGGGLAERHDQRAEHRVGLVDVVGLEGVGRPGHDGVVDGQDRRHHAGGVAALQGAVERGRGAVDHLRQQRDRLLLRCGGRIGAVWRRWLRRRAAGAARPSRHPAQLVEGDGRAARPGPLAAAAAEGDPAAAAYGQDLGV